MITGRTIIGRFRSWVLLFLLLPATGMAAMDATPPHVSIGADVLVLDDRERAFDLEDVERGAAAAAFRPLATDVPSFGFANAAVWLRFELVNDDPEALDRLLVVECSWLDGLTLWVRGPDGDLVRQHFGDTLPYGERGYDHPLPVFRLSLPPGTSTLYLRAEARDPLLVPVDLWEPEAFARQDRWTSFYYGVFYGAIAIMALYNLFLFLFLRDRPYLFYVLYLAAFLVMNLTYNGFTYALVWRDSPEWVNWLHPITIYLFQITGVLFAIHFLGTRLRNPYLHRFLLAFLAVLVLALLGSWLLGGYYAHVSLSIALVVTYTLTVVVAGLMSWYRGNRAARFFIIGSLSSLVGASITALVVAGVLPYHFATYRAVEFGMMLDVTLLAMALADRYNIMRQERDRVEAQYRDSLAQTKQTLEQEVAIRTQELRTAKEQAENLARTDELTGINNRRAFYDYGMRALEIAHRHRHPVSLLMMDLDHFKEINDSFGHAAGDALLVAVSEIVREAVRGTDILGRLGGEEFGIVLPHTELGAARDLAEKLRATIARLELRHEGEFLSVTASIGVAECRYDDNLDTLISRADGALYAAKREGRNRVVCA
ncbi:MAG: diguanylate cyclase [Gammaproteobacteria bacterium]|nr:diguanylate cyclase [Gammaproteobacteria bacterium]MDX5374547.1 diguanylate cyclase [Gammaproteobacteria bacterium]